MEGIAHIHLVISNTGSDGVLLHVVSDVVDERQCIVVHFVVVAEQFVAETDVVISTFFDVYEGEWCAVGTTGIGDAGVGCQELVADFVAQIAFQFSGNRPYFVIE